MVSIPQSGFLVVTLPVTVNHLLAYEVFQSLSRDSWWSHWVQVLRSGESMWLVSIPQSGFLVVTPHESKHVHHEARQVSIPQSGFLVVTPTCLYFLNENNLRFNPCYKYD